MLQLLLLLSCWYQILVLQHFFSSLPMLLLAPWGLYTCVALQSLEPHRPFLLSWKDLTAVIQIPNSTEICCQLFCRASPNTWAAVSQRSVAMWGGPSLVADAFSLSLFFLPRCWGSPPTRTAAWSPLCSCQAILSTERPASLPRATAGAAEPSCWPTKEPPASTQARCGF